MTEGNDVSLCQIELHTNLEEKMPYWLLKRVDQSSITIYPNRKCSKVGMVPGPGFVKHLIVGFKSTR
jgi:hypothetical protein